MIGIALSLAWVATYVLLARYGVYLLPVEFARQLTLPSYLALVQLLTALWGAGVLLLLHRKHPELHFQLVPFPSQNSKDNSWRRKILYAFLLAPLLYSAAHALGMYLAFDTLISELAQKGARAVQAQTGELGRAAAQDSIWIILPFTVLIAPFGEELVFRGALFGSVQTLVDRKRRTRENERSSIEIPGLEHSRPRGRGAAFLLRYGVALLVSSIVFGVLHADTPGGMGILRLATASTLGLACGLARAVGGGLVFPIALHVLYNLISLATMRGWLVTSGWPTKYALPTVLIPLSAFGLLALLMIQFLRRRSFTRTRVESL